MLDVFNTTKKLVALNFLLSTRHRSLCASGVAAPQPFSRVPLPVGDAGTATVSFVGWSLENFLTNRGSLVIFTGKVTSEKVFLLVQKYLYGTDISMAYADPY